MYCVYMHNKNTGNKIFILEFEEEKDAVEFCKENNTNPSFHYYVSNL